MTSNTAQSKSPSSEAAPPTPSDPAADLPAGDLPPVPKWTVVAAFALWAGWLIFLLIIR